MLVTAPKHLTFEYDRRGVNGRDVDFLTVNQLVAGCGELVRVTPAPRTENTDSFAREPFLRNADRKLRMYFR